MKPEIIYPVDETKYVYAICRCPVDTRYGLKMEKKPGVTGYHFYCDDCGTAIEVCLNTTLD